MDATVTHNAPEAEMDQIATMNKKQLRQACKENGIPYGKLTVGGMKDALRAKLAPVHEVANGLVEDGDKEWLNEDEKAPEPVITPALETHIQSEGQYPTPNVASLGASEAIGQMTDAALTVAADVKAEPLSTPAPRDLSKLGLTGVDGHCPHCNIDLDNGVATYNDICDTSKSAAGKMKFEIVCLGCDGEWGPQVDRTPAPVATGTGLKIEKGREERNGIKRPSIGGACRAVWDALDAMVAEGKSPTAKDVKAMAPVRGWNVNNASIEFYQWRKFNGIVGRK
jgi:hypothetical protein